MKIFFSKREYRQLLDLVYMGDWMVAALYDGEKTPYDDLRNKIYFYARDLVMVI